MSFAKNAITTAVKTLLPERQWNKEAVTNTPWVRNPSWLPITAPSPTEQKIVGLYRIESGTTYASFKITGSITVDWGDGSAPENVSAAVTATHLYNYNSAALDGTDAPATLTQSTSTVNRNNHGYTNGMVVTLYNITTTTGLVVGSRYYVINATTDTFQVAKSVGGSAVTFGTGDGTCTLLEHKQAVITITPQVGYNMTNVIFSDRPSVYTVTGTSASTGWLDIEMALPLCSKLYWASQTFNSYTGGWWHSKLERFSLRSSLIRQCNYFFYNCPSLRSVPNFAVDTTLNTLSFTSSATGVQTVNNTFRADDTVYFLSNGNMTTPSLIFTSGIRYYVSSASLTSTTAGFASSPGSIGVTFSTAGNLVTGYSGVSADYMFYNCFSLTEVPEAIKAIPSIVVAQFMFANCYSLAVVEGLTLTYCGAAESMFYQCFALGTVSGLDTKNITRIQNMFATCYALTDVGYLETSQVRQAANLFDRCYSLESAPPLNLERCLQTGSMFYQCYSLKYVPALNMPLVTLASQMFMQCYALQKIPDMYAPAVTSASSMFNACTLLSTISSVSLPAATDCTSLFSNCMNLREVGDVYIPNCTVIANMFSNCYALVSVRTITTTSVLTNMGTMFSNCNSLKEAPWINTSGVTTATGVFQNCYSLRSVPAYDLALNTVFSNFFVNCTGLTDVPALNTEKATAMISMYSGCVALRNAPVNSVAATTSTSATSNIYLNCISLRTVRTPFKFTFTVANASMSAASLDAMYTALPTVTGQTVTVSGNIGTTTDTPSIATAKGWTVTG